VHRIRVLEEELDSLQGRSAEVVRRLNEENATLRRGLDESQFQIVQEKDSHEANLKSSQNVYELAYNKIKGENDGLVKEIAMIKETANTAYAALQETLVNTQNQNKVLQENLTTTQNIFNQKYSEARGENAALKTTNERLKTEFQAEHQKQTRVFQNLQEEHQKFQANSAKVHQQWKQSYEGLL
jgi:hypothetical protein